LVPVKTPLETSASNGALPIPRVWANSGIAVAKGLASELGYHMGPAHREEET
jgi:hypothetical protein